MWLGVQLWEAASVITRMASLSKRCGWLLLLLLLFCVVYLLWVQLVFLLVGVTPVIIAQASGRHTAALGLANDGLTYSPSVQPASPAPTAPTSALQTDRAPSGDGLPAHLLYILLSGLVASRFGLWLFDLAVTQLQQELVPETGLGE